MRIPEVVRRMHVGNSGVHSTISGGIISAVSVMSPPREIEITQRS